MVRGKKILGLLLAFVLCFSLMIPVQATSVDEAKKKADELEQQKKAAEGEQASLGNQLNAIITDMQKTQDSITQKETEIEQAEAELLQAKVEENKQYASMKKRIKYMYENGSEQFIAVLLDSKNLADFLNKAEYVSKISEYDRDMLTEFQVVVQSVADKEVSLKSEYTSLQTLQADLTTQQTNVQSLLESKNTQIADLQSQIGENAAVLQTLIDRAAAAEKAQQEAAAAKKPSGGSNGSSGNNGGVYVPPGAPISGGGSGKFINPCPGAHISSEFGEYRSPSDPAHKGTDFGTSGQYLPTYAAAAGRVVYARYSNSAGNWVVIDHGEGFVTKYMHHSALTVTEGQMVAQGAQIGVTGNTGQSFGIHLHFQVEKNGSAVNPRNYM